MSMATFEKKVVEENGLFYPCYVINGKLTYISNQGKILECDTREQANEYLED